MCYKLLYFQRLPFLFFNQPPQGPRYVAPPTLTGCLLNTTWIIAYQFLWQPQMARLYLFFFFFPLIVKASVHTPFIKGWL